MTEFEKDVIGVCKFLSNEVIQLYKSALVQTPYEAFTVLFHCFMLESGFIPKDVSEKSKFQCMPEKWNGNVLYKLFYSHSYCPSFICCMTCVRLYKNISVQGTLSDAECPESIDIQIQMTNYLKDKRFFAAVEDFKNLNELSRYFKDGFCLPLLNLLCETAGSSRLYGLRGMVDEIKIYMLKFLPVQDVVSMSALNKKFNILANSPELWKYMFLRDFTKGGLPDVESSSTFNDWKQKYKQEYLKKNRNARGRSTMYSYIMDPDDPDLFIGFPRILDPFDPAPYLFPPMMPRLPPYFRRLI